jgi:predicted DNA-binding transcriptional regulator AlpA
MNAPISSPSTKLRANKVINFDSPLWRIDTVLAYVPISKSGWLNGVKLGNMPQPIKMPGSKAVAWRKENVQAWIAELK